MRSRFCSDIRRLAVALAALACVVAAGCTATEVAPPAGPAGATRPAPTDVPDEVTRHDVMLEDGPASGRYQNVLEFDPHMAESARARVEVSFDYPSYFKVDTAAGTVYSVVTLRNGNSRVVLTVYKNTIDAGSVASSLKSAIQAWYSGAKFVHQPPRLLIEPANRGAQGSAPAVQAASEWNLWPWGTPRIVQMTSDGSVIEEGRMGDPDQPKTWTTWDVGKPENLPGSESAFEGEEGVADDPEAYISNRQKTWDWESSGNPTTDLFHRKERWYHDTSVWDRYERKGSNDELVQGRTAYCYHNGFRYHVIVESANLGQLVPSGPAPGVEARGGTIPEGENARPTVLADQVAVHVVCFYPETEAPIIEEVISMFRQSLRAHLQRSGSGSSPTGP